MPAYRLYRLDGAGKITNAEWIEADADEQALQQAHALTGREQRFELWDRERLIACVRSGSRQ